MNSTFIEAVEIMVNTYPNDFYQQVEFDKILKLAADHAYNPLTKDKILNLRPDNDFEWISFQLNLVDELLKTIIHGERFPIRHFNDIYDSLSNLSIEDYVLDLEEIVDIGIILSMVEEMGNWLNKGRRVKYKILADIVESFPDLSLCLSRYREIIDDKGEVKENASDKLKSLSKSLQAKQRQILGEFDRSLKKYKDYLAESSESIRSGRKVLSVLAEYKRQIPGIIHDESSRGRVVYIEPQTMVLLNNEYYDIQNDIRKEIYLILRRYCNLLSEYLEELKVSFELLLDLDIVQAKAVLAYDLEALKPALNNKPKIKLLKAKHPLLKLKLKKSDEFVVPFDLELFPPNKILLISGPNAGGKSVTLKTIGLVQLMHQCGFLTTVHEDSELGIFNDFFCDIGDQQSLEEDLSTYSSRLKNMKAILEKASNHSLILVDEFGSGTDPGLGSALAESILFAFNKNRYWAIITTHYSNLKIFAYKTKGIVNGGMKFNQSNHSPTFELQVGKPGNSYTFEIAERIGLPEKIVSYAKQRAGKNNIALEDLLMELENDQKKYVQLQKELEKKQRLVDQLMKNYQELKGNLEFGRAKLKEEQKQQKLQQNNLLNEELNKKIKELRSEKDLEKLEKLKRQVKKENVLIQEEVEELGAQLVEAEAGEDFIKNISIGDTVKVRKTGMIGEVIEKDDRKAIVVSGLFRIDVELKDLLPAKEQLEVKKKSIQQNLVERNSNTETKLDIRGHRPSEALDLVQRFLDEAMIANMSMVRILHGKGTGALKKVVWNKVKEYPIKEIKHPEPEWGGEGISIITF